MQERTRALYMDGVRKVGCDHTFIITRVSYVRDVVAY